ncbi:MAG: U32 family peptidase [Smithellaceae bacterium]
MRTAILYGADAVYIGVLGLSLRSPAAEMTSDDLATGIKDAHAAGVRVYAALNTFARQSDLDQAKQILPGLIATGVDALIVSDPGLIRLIRNIAPHMPLHLSTQANTTNAEAVRFWQDQGIRRIILARELTLKEIRQIAAAVPDMELEMFIHGAMCMAYSGRCYLSAHRNRRSANEGDCSQPCRWEYLLTEKTRPSDPFILEADERFSYLLSSKDLCLIDHLPDVLASGLTSVKIEGRMKSAYYVAVITRAYRHALNALSAQQKGSRLRLPLSEEIKTVSHRGYTTGFAFAEERINETSPDVKIIQTHEPAGIVISCDAAQGQALIEVRNHLRAGDDITLLLPDENIKIDTTRLYDENGNGLSEAHPKSRLQVTVGKKTPQGALLRKTAINA